MYTIYECLKVNQLKKNINLNNYRRLQSYLRRSRVLLLNSETCLARNIVSPVNQTANKLKPFQIISCSAVLKGKLSNCTLFCWLRLNPLDKQNAQFKYLTTDQTRKHLCNCAFFVVSEFVWQVSMCNRGLGEGRTGLYQLCLTERTLTMLKIDEPIPQLIEIFLTNVRTCGNLKNFFYLEVSTFYLSKKSL